MDWKLLVFELSSESKKELAWWSRNAGEWMNMELENVANSGRMMDIQVVDSGNFASGNINNLCRNWNFSKEINWNFAIKKLENLSRTVCSANENSRIRINCDDLQVFWTMQRGRSFCLELNNLVKRIGGDLKSRKIKLQLDWAGDN